MSTNTIELEFYPNTGTQYIFKALVIGDDPLDKGKIARFANIDESIKGKLTFALRFTKEHAEILNSMRNICSVGGTPWREVKSKQLREKGRFIRYRLGEQKIIADDGSYILLYGIWFVIETNMGDNTRGTIIENKAAKEFSQQELNDALAHREDEVPNVYMQLPPNTEWTCNFTCSWENASSGNDEDDETTLDLTLKVIVQRENGKPIPVDLVLDLGNSRSVALLLEHGDNGTYSPDQFSTYCRPLAIQHCVWDYYLKGSRPKDDCIVSSAFVLQTPRFEEGDVSLMGDARSESMYLQEWQFKLKEKNILDKAGSFFKTLTGEKETEEYEVERRNTRLPQMFVRLSPALLGTEADQALNKSENYRKANARYFQSSPKRYYWDLDQEASGTYWNMLRPPWIKNEFKAEIPRLKCELLRFMPLDGHILDSLDADDSKPETVLAPNPDPPNFPRASSLTWMLLGILERAWEQANNDTSEHRQRLLRNIVITYPSGWLPSEIDMYKKRCQEAVNIFAKTNFPAEEQNKVKLVMDIDEAVASQMPFVFTDITHISDTNNWLELMGKKRNGKPSVNIMNLDIGGGTTDFSIINYSGRKDSGIALNIDLLFKDGFAVAGDDLLRQIIEGIIIEGIIQTKSEIRELRSWFEAPFKNGSNATKDCVERSLHVKQVLFPMAVRLLSLHNSHSTSFVFSPEEAGISADSWNNFVRFLNKDLAIPVTERFSFSDAAIKNYVEDLFKVYFESCATYAAAYDIDLLVISGKTSEIPEIIQLIQNIFPFSPDCIIPTKNFRAGNWYPKFSEDKNSNLISDAKTVTAVGAALHFALSNKIISGWTIKTHNSYATGNTEDADHNNIWSIICGTIPRDFNLIDKERNLNRFMKKNEDENEKPCIMNNGTIIFRELREDSHPEPVFRFCNINTKNDTQSYEVNFKRVTDQFGGDSLELTSVYLHDDDDLAETDQAERTNLVENFALHLCPMATNQTAGNWQESGIVML